MGIVDYFAIVRKRWISVLLMVVLGAGVAAAGSYASTPVYSAGARIYVSTQVATGSVNELVQGSNFSRQQVESYGGLATTQIVLAPAAAALGGGVTAAQLAGSVTADVASDTSLITISATSTDAELAARSANAVADSFKKVIEDIESPEDGSVSPVKVTVAQRASTPGAPFKPKPQQDIALGILVGLGLGVAAAVIRERLDTAVRTEADVRRIVPAPVLGNIHREVKQAASSIVMLDDPLSVRAEAYRQLRTNLQFVAAGKAVRSVVVTSSVPSEGKSTTSANLAASVAEGGARVLLIEGDLRRPRLAEVLGLVAGAGLTDVLVGRAEVDDVLQPWGRTGRLDALLSGPVPPNPSELLGSDVLRELLGRLEDQYDLVVVDAPPLLPVTDAAVLSTITGGALVVVGAQRVTEHDLERALSLLSGVSARILGVVMNFTTAGRVEMYGYGPTAPASPRARGTERRLRGSKSSPRDATIGV